jgi:hypothetical protein
LVSSNIAESGNPLQLTVLIGKASINGGFSSKPC